MIATVETVSRMTVRFGTVRNRGLASENPTKQIAKASRSPLFWMNAKTLARPGREAALPAAADAVVNVPSFLLLLARSPGHPANRSSRHRPADPVEVGQAHEPVVVELEPVDVERSRNLDLGTQFVK